MLIWLVAFAVAFYLGWNEINKMWLWIAPAIGTIAAVGGVNRVADLRSELGLSTGAQGNMIISALVIVAIATAIMFLCYWLGEKARDRYA